MLKGFHDLNKVHGIQLIRKNVMQIETDMVQQS